MLTMNVQQLRTGLTQLRDGRHMTVDQSARTTIAIHHTPQQQLTRIALQFALHQPLLQQRQRLDGELGRHFGALGAAAYLIGIGTSAQCQCQSIDQDGFTRTGFSGERSEAGLKLQLQFLDDDEIANGKL